MTQAVLAQLQLLDTEMDALRKHHAEIEKLVAERGALDRTEAEESGAAAKASDSRARQRDRELELTSLETRIAELDRRLYSGRIHNTKELESLSNEAQMFKDHKRKLEETVLSLMDETEQAERSSDTAQRGAESARLERSQAEREWHAELTRLQSEVEVLQGRAAELRLAVLPDHLETYDRMRRRGGLVVVRVRGHNCGACGVELSARVLEQARDAHLLPASDNCGRVLQSN